VNTFRRITLSLAVVFAIGLAGASPAAGASATSYLAFLNHRITFYDQITGHVDHSISDLDVEDYSGSGAQDKLLSAHYAAETKWTTSHKPLACYKALWTATRHEAAHGKARFAASSRWLLAFPYGTDADYATFETQSDAMADASDAILAAYDKVTC
jgi:hypothetical protein